jgi:hypothetical protein
MRSDWMAGRARARRRGFLEPIITFVNKLDREGGDQFDSIAMLAIIELTRCGPCWVRNGWARTGVSVIKTAVNACESAGCRVSDLNLKARICC